MFTEMLQHLRGRNMWTADVADSIYTVDIYIHTVCICTVLLQLLVRILM